MTPLTPSSSGSAGRGWHDWSGRPDPAPRAEPSGRRGRNRHVVELVRAVGAAVATARAARPDAARPGERASALARGERGASGVSDGTLLVSGPARLEPPGPWPTTTGAS